MPRPRSTLFPYTTLFRSRGCLTVPRLTLMSLIKMMLVMVSVAAISKTFGLLQMRSEERFSRNAETEIYTLSLHDALPISWMPDRTEANPNELNQDDARYGFRCCHLKNIWTAPNEIGRAVQQECRDRDLHSFPTRRSSDLVDA